MAGTSDRNTAPWVAFLAAAEAAQALPDVPPPRLPDAPRIPEAPPVPLPN